MNLQDKFERPPAWIYEACDAQFQIARFRGVIFTVGPFLFNPDRVPISQWLRAHEQVHSDRQLASGDVDAWWRRYLEDVQFRFDEELLAHQREWEVMKVEIPSREQRRRELAFICERLSGPLYGSIVPKRKAYSLITGREAVL